MISPAFHRFASRGRGAVNQYLAQLLRQVDAPQQLRGAMQYAVLEGGKLLRPLLVLAAVQDSGGSQEDALPLAAAAELVHAYSLVHDDLPAMDNDDYRRGKLAVHRHYGEAMAILTGNALLALAAQAALEARPSAHAPGAARLLLAAAGASGICGGQSLDLGLEGQLGDIQQMLHCYRLKTGSLFGACAAAGAVLAQGGGAPAKSLDQFGRCLGEAFQIFDDLAEPAPQPRSLLVLTDRGSAHDLARESMHRARHLLGGKFATLRELTLYLEDLTDVK